MNQGSYILRRVLHMLFVFWIILTMLFFLFRLGLPDPTHALIAEGLSVEDRAQIRQSFGLDEPLITQYVLYLQNTLRGDFGFSFRYNAPVAGMILERLMNTIVLTGAALFLAYLIGPLLGVLLSWKRGTRLEFAGIVAGLLSRSAPGFWTGMLGIVLFGVMLGWVPTSGMRTLPYTADGFLDKILTLDFLHHLLLPALIMGFYYLGLPMLIMRNTMLEVMGEDFIELCRAKGMGERQVMYRHAARNAMLPLVTQAAISIGLAVGGQVVIETVFSWPGLGREMFQAISASDYPVAQAAFMLMAATVLVMNFFVDMLYGYLDPRVLGREGGSR